MKKEAILFRLLCHVNLHNNGLDKKFLSIFLLFRAKTI